MSSSGIDFDAFARLIGELVEDGTLGQPPDTNDDEDATLVYAWAVLGVLRLDQDYRSYEEFVTERRQYVQAKNPIMRALWLVLTPKQRSVFGALTHLSRVVAHKRRRDEDDDGGRALVKYQAGPGRERRQALEKVQFMMDEMLPEIRRAIAEEMALRPMMRFMMTSKASKVLVEDVFQLFLQRDILANLDYEHAELVKVAAVGRAFMAEFAPDGRHFWRTRDLNPEEKEWMLAELKKVGVLSEDTEELPAWDNDMLRNVLLFGPPSDVTPFRIYREVMETIASSIWGAYPRWNVVRGEVIWVSFSTLTRGHLFDVRFARTARETYGEPVALTTRELRVLTGNEDIQRLFAPLRDFYRTRGRVRPSLVIPVYHEADPDDSDDEDEMYLTTDPVEDAEEASVFMNSMLNLLYGLSPLLTMTVETQPEQGPIKVVHVALDTNGFQYTPEQYAKRSTAVAAAAAAASRQQGHAPFLSSLFAPKC